MGVDEVPERMSYGEAYRHAVTLSRDPSSMLAAAMAGLTHPVSREWLALADLFDLIGGAGKAQGLFKKAPSYPRPMPEPERESTSYGDAAGRSAAEVIAILRDAAHMAFDAEPEREIYEPPDDIKKEPRVVMTDG